MRWPALKSSLEQYHRTLAAFIQGDPEPTLRLWSKRDDVTLANPFGPPVRGWNEVRDIGACSIASHGR